MKKSLLMLFVPTFCFSSVNYNVIITPEHNKYKDEESMIPTGNIVCKTFDILEDDIYYGFNATQTGSECEEEFLTLDGNNSVWKPTSDQIYNIVGTHFENSCKEIMNNNYSQGDNIYSIGTLQNNYEVYCNMSIDGGGWTLLMTENDGRNEWSQFGATHIGTPLNDDYRSSINVANQLYTDIMWYNHPNNEFSIFTQRTNTQLTLSGSPTTENNTYVYYASKGERKTNNAYYNLIQCHYFADHANPILMLSGSDQYGNDKGGVTTGKSCESWESDTTSWYYRFSGGVTSHYIGNPWKENGHTPRPSRLQSFYIR